MTENVVITVMPKTKALFIMAEWIIFQSIDFQRSSKDGIHFSHNAAFTLLGWKTLKEKTQGET